MSLIVVAYNMGRELPRTLLSLSSRLQRGIDPKLYETIVVDNGSERAVVAEEGVQVIRIDDAPVSPVSGINLALSEARGDLVGVLIDGARIATPGLIAAAATASRLHHRPVIATLGFHLGPDVQMQSVSQGYNQEAEDRLLEGIDWPSDPYRLFQVAVLAGSSAGGLFRPMAESNALFTTREMWEELGGFDPAFESPGGGLVNLDTYRRACLLPHSQLIMLLGEGTFHQVHGGVATNASRSPWDGFHAEYKSVRGSNFQAPTTKPIFFGRVPEHALWVVRQSAELADDERSK